MPEFNPAEPVTLGREAFTRGELARLLDRNGYLAGSEALYAGDSVRDATEGYVGQPPSYSDPEGDWLARLIDAEHEGER